MLPPFRVLNPTTVQEAGGELERLGEGAKVYAGGAELILLLRHGVTQADYLVNIKRIPTLNELVWTGPTLRIGATVTHRRLETDPQIRQRLPLFAEAESRVGNIRVRGQGTLGGNLCFADPHADPGTALLVHEATVIVQGSGAPRALLLDEFLVGTYETALEPGEILVSIEVPPLPEGWGHAYERVERFHRPTLNTAVAVKKDGDRIGDARLAVGCVGPKPVRLTDLEEKVRGATSADALSAVASAKPYLEELLDPVDDLLGSAAYKIHITSVLLGRALISALEGTGRNGHA